MDLGDQIESIVLNLPYCLRISILVLHSDKSSCLRHTWELFKVPQDTGIMPVLLFSTKPFILGNVGGGGGMGGGDQCGTQLLQVPCLQLTLRSMLKMPDLKDPEFLLLLRHA